MDISWPVSEDGYVRGVPVHADTVPLWEEFLAPYPGAGVSEDGPLSLRVTVGSGKSAGFPIRETRRLCKDLGIAWGYPEEPDLFVVTADRDAVMLRYRREPVRGLRRTLSRGDYGDDVRQAQLVMARLGAWDGEVSGRFTNEFMKAVREYQGARGWRVSGTVDRLLWNHLQEESGNVHSFS